MARAERVNRLATSSRRLSIVGVVLVVGTIIAAGAVIWDGRKDAFASYRREMASLGIAVAEQAARSLQAVDLVLRETQRDVESAGIADPEAFKRDMATEHIYSFLSRHSKNLPQADVIGLVAADGDLVNGTRRWPTPQLNFSNRDWFTYLRDHDDRTLFVSGPARSRVTGAWSFYLARRLNGPRGELFGMVVAGIEARYFEEFYRAISLDDGGSIALFGRDGTLIVRYPRAESKLGEKLPPQSEWYARVAAGGGAYRTPGFIDGVARLVSAHPLRDYPLVVTVTVSEHAALAEWRREAKFVAIGAGCLVVTFILLFGTLTARSRRLERHSGELADSAEALRRSESRFRDFALTSSDWFWETDEQHRFIYQSAEVRVFGQDPNDRIGRTRLDLAADAAEQPEKWRAHLAALENREPFRDFVYAHKIGDGPVAIISVSGRPIFDGDNRFLGYRGTARDVTEEFLAERRLNDAKVAAEAANHAKSQFLANVSHELRTPLNAIIGFSEMLELGIAGPLQPRQADYVGLIRQSGGHLHDVINDILDLAKVDAGKLDLHEEAEVDPRRVIDACVAIVNERARLGRLRLSIDCDEQLPFLVADETRLKQILLNLLSNAIKFTDVGGEVVVGAHRGNDGTMVFEVRDTGTGMTEDEISTAIEPFGQVDGGLARRHEGTGLGLPLARHLTELHNGVLQIDSVKGVGTTVAVILPASRLVADRGAAESNPRSGPADFGAAAA